ncbi:hypothetical protein B0H19DRAFT_1071187 [Mycena capillaripes]|nr:hypothetical protein B0H19DRAFT_1071187 [Mycena capillaripes]
MKYCRMICGLGIRLLQTEFVAFDLGRVYPAGGVGQIFHAYSGLLLSPQTTMGMCDRLTNPSAEQLPRYFDLRVGPSVAEENLTWAVPSSPRFTNGGGNTDQPAELAAMKSYPDLGSDIRGIGGLVDTCFTCVDGDCEVVIAGTLSTERGTSTKPLFFEHDQQDPRAADFLTFGTTSQIRGSCRVGKTVKPARTITDIEMEDSREAEDSPGAEEAQIISQHLCRDPGRPFNEYRAHGEE